LLEEEVKVKMSHIFGGVRYGLVALDPIFGCFFVLLEDNPREHFHHDLLRFDQTIADSLFHLSLQKEDVLFVQVLQ